MDTDTVYCIGRYTALGSAHFARIGHDPVLANQIRDALNQADNQRWRAPLHFVYTREERSVSNRVEVDDTSRA